MLHVEEANGCIVAWRTGLCATVKLLHYISDRSRCSVGLIKACIGYIYISETLLGAPGRPMLTCIACWLSNLKTASLKLRSEACCGCGCCWLMTSSSFLLFLLTVTSIFMLLARVAKSVSSFSACNGTLET